MSSGVSEVAVLGAGGATGRALISSLAARGGRPRAVVRRPDYADRVPLATSVRVADLAVQAEIAAAIEGARAVHLIPPVYNENEERFAANVIAACMDAGVDRITYHSVLHAPTPAMPHHARKARVELLIRDSDLSWTIIQPAMYMQTALAYFSLERRALTPAFSIDQSFNMIDLPDLADAVAAVLTDPGHDCATYELAGVERLTFRQMAEVLSEVLGQTVAASEADAPTLLAARAKIRGFSARQTEELAAMFRQYDRHGLRGNGNVLTMLLGRAPRRFRDAVSDRIAG